MVKWLVFNLRTENSFLWVVRLNWLHPRSLTFFKRFPKAKLIVIIGGCWRGNSLPLWSGMGEIGKNFIYAFKDFGTLLKISYNRMEKGIAQIKVTECKNFGQGKNEREHILIFYEWLTVLDSMEDHTRKPSGPICECDKLFSTCFKFLQGYDCSSSN